MAKLSAASPLGVKPRTVTRSSIPSAPACAALSTSNTWPRSTRLSRPMRIPSAVVHRDDSPCLPAVDTIAKRNAVGGGLARSTSGVWAAAAWASNSDASRVVILINPHLSCLIASERVIEPREGGNALGAVADVHVSDHERLRDAAKADAVDTVQIGERVGAGARIYPADIDEGRQFHVDGGRGGIEGQHLAPEFDAAGKGVSIVEASLAEAAQRLLSAHHAGVPADGAERPERHGVRCRQVAYGQVPHQDRVRCDGPERASVSAGLAVHRIVQQAGAAGQAAVGNQLHAASGYRQIIAGVIDDGQPIEQLLTGAQPDDVVEAKIGRAT